MRLRPMAFIVLDAGGQIVAYQREDDSGTLRFEIAYGKAYGSLGIKRSSRAIAEMAEHATLFIQSLTAVAGGRLIPSPGSVLVRNAKGRIVGAVGATGDAADADEACAILGTRAAGFIPDPEEPMPGAGRRKGISRFDR